MVFGTGAIGGYYGGMLAQSGADVSFIARGNNYNVLCKKGLTIITEENKITFPVKVFNSTKGLGKFDYVFICVKSFDTKSTLDEIKENIGPQTTIASLQNGIENEELIIKSFGKEKVIGAFVYIASQLIEPGIVKVLGNKRGMIGELNGAITSRVEELHNMFKIANVDFAISENILGDMWDKLVWNVSFNPTSVATGKTVDKLLEEDYDLVKNIMTEVKNVAIANGIKIRLDTVEFNLERTKGYKGFKTSMLQDFERGKSLEVDAILGVVLRKAKEKNVPVPNIEKLYEQLKTKLCKPCS